MKDSLNLPVALLGLGAAAITACGILPADKGEGPQGVVNRRVLGLSSGDFLQRYGAPLTRSEAADRSLTFTWESEALRSPAGPYGAEESICRLRLTTDTQGRIVSALILYDGQSPRRPSRCAELFAPA